MTSLTVETSTFVNHIRDVDYHNQSVTPFSCDIPESAGVPESEHVRFCAGS